MKNINNKFLKNIVIIQVLSISFAIIGELYIRFLINHDWLFSNEILFILEIILLTIIYITLISLFLDGKWVNIPIIVISYIIYYFIISIESNKLFPMNTDPNDYGIGILILLITVFQIISVLISSIIGTAVKQIRNKDRSK